MSEGDKNTHFFHQRASRRKKKNKITRLTRPDGTITEDQCELQQLSREFYTDLYRSEGTNGMDEVLAAVPVSVTAEMNAKLTAPFKEQEVKTALFQMYPTKAPGPDGYPAHFFQRHWDLCGEEVTRSVLRILRGEEDPEGINKTFIVLIPKVAKQRSLASSDPLVCAMLFIKLPLRFLRTG